MNKSMQTAVIGTVLGGLALGLAFKYLGSQPVIRDARQGYQGGA